ncbi:MAG: DivIVA domain-containing protein [Proteobacteria bacterium]|nr:DivIVA domain-containing protein [Pseudomonadota bacterium]MBU1738812.1 DivIVA domain-containing protein [Pseudomonadota bacterium]
MPITPQDIQSKQFHVRMRGFDVDEVDKFLEKIAEEFLILTLENKQIIEKVESMEKEIANFRNKEQTFQNAILSAQRISDEMQEKSRQEAEKTLTLARKESEELQARVREEAEALQERAHKEASEMKRNARAEASRLESDARARIAHLTSEVNTLIGMKDRITNDLRALLGNYLQKINEAVPETLNTLEELPEPEFSGRSAGDFSLSADDREDDLGDLYEKIDLPDDTFSSQDEETEIAAPEPQELGLDDLEPLGLEDEEEPGTMVAVQIDGDEGFDQDPDISIPDLDGEMLFSLDDPLDELEPSVRISPEKNIDR